MGMSDKEQLYYCYAEYNENEDETWHVFIPSNGVFDPDVHNLCNIVESLAKMYSDEGVDCPYWFETNQESQALTLYTQSEVDVLMKMGGDSGYFPNYSIREIKDGLSCECPDGVDEFDFYDNQLYKLGCFSELN